MDAADPEGPAAAPPRLFTLDEANALLPRVRELLGDIQSRAERVAELQGRLDAFREQKRAGEHAVAGEARLVQQALGEATRLGLELRTALEALLGLGCELKDVRSGLVDFPSLREARIVYLCWRLGEDEIRYWHELDAGFAGRHPL
jgi:hypothetical protein